MNLKLNTRLALLLSLAVVILVLPAPAYCDVSGDRNPWMVDDFVLSIGTFLPNKKVRMNADGQVPGSEVDFSNGLDATSDDITASGTLRWRFGEKWSLWGQYFSSSDSAENTLTKDIIWEDEVYKAGARVGAGVDLKVARIFFGRNIITGDRYEFGLGLGLHWLKFGAYIEGEAEPVDGDQPVQFLHEGVDAHAPLPNIGGWYWYEFSPRWLLTARIDWLGATIGDYSGSMWNGNAGINFQAWEHVGFRLSYQLFKIDVDVDKDDWHGGANLNYSGPFASINFNW